MAMSMTFEDPFLFLYFVPVLHLSSDNSTRPQEVLLIQMIGTGWLC